MNNKEIVKNSKIIKVYGNKATIEKAIKFLEQLNLNGNEDNDRLLIQECIDNNKLGARISYEGKTIYSFNKIVKMYKILQKDGTLENLNKDMYDFLMNACEDIAHYDLSGYKIHYDNSFEKLEKELLLNPHLTSRYSDINKIFKELNIGEYYTDIQFVDLEKISLNKFKEIIEKCDWRVIPTDVETDWELEVNLNKDNKFSFILDVSSGSVASILFNLYKYNKDYDADEYIEEAVEAREYSYIPPVRRIVLVADLIGEKLSKLVSDLFYRCRIEIENISKYERTLDKEMER